MFKNYLKTALRTIARNRVFALINIFGLAFGIACFAFISFWVWDELRIDHFHENGKNIYQMYGEVNRNGESTIRQYVPSAMVEPILTSLPEVEAITRVFPSEAVFGKGDSKFSEKGIYADSSFLNIFSFPLKEGSISDMFSQTNAVIISSKLAEKYFPDEMALGKQIDIIQNQKQSYVVAGVLEDLPDYSSLKFDYILSYDNFEKTFRPWWGKENKNSFTNFNVTVYAQLQAGVEPEVFDQKLNRLFDNYLEDKGDQALFVYPFSEVYLHSDFSNGRIPTGKITYVKLLFVIALIVLLIACINFINLSTAMANKRAKEVGLRKTIGAQRRQIILQFLIESIGISLVALVVAIASVEMLMPAFNLLTQKSIEVPFSSISFILLLATSGITLGLLAGVYPAYLLSSFKISKTLKNNSSTAGLGGFRKVLVTIQFTLSIIFIVFTIVVFHQIDFIKNKELGIRKNNIIVHPLHGIKGKQSVYKKELLDLPGIQSVCFTEQDPFSTSNANAGVSWQGKHDNAAILFNVIQVDEDFLNTFELKLIDGKGFSENDGRGVNEFIINEEAAKAMMIDNPVGMDLTVWGYNGRVIGEISNYHHRSLSQSIGPVVIVCNPKATFNAYISFDNTAKQEVIAAVQSIYKKYEQDYIFDYTFVDDQYQKNYGDIEIVGKLSSVFAFAAILISCLGLFGLSAFITEQKLKETGIRKVLGATELGLLYLFSSGFIRLVVLSFLIAAPIAWFSANHWLEGFAYHISIGVAPFAIAGVSAVLIALFTVTYNTLRAARTNPVNVLKE
ncbi:MAG TPA: ABC transporter permease [Fulvivirga sp.]|nr:ABC transporter permease [Fulvivirga sp.]